MKFFLSLFVATSLLVPRIANAVAASYTQTTKAYTISTGHVLTKVRTVMTADSATGAFPTVTLTRNGRLVRVVVDPTLGTAPTTSFTVTLNDPDTHTPDLLAAQLGSLVNNALTQITPQGYTKAAAAAAMPQFIYAGQTLTATGNSVNSAVLGVTLFIEQ